MSRRVNYTVYNHGMAGMPRLNHDLYKMHLYFAKVSVSTCMKFRKFFEFTVRGNFATMGLSHFIPVLGTGGSLHGLSLGTWS